MIVKIKTIKDTRGSLGVIGEDLPFKIMRTFFLYDVTKERGGHRHKSSTQALICLNGRCDVNVQTQTEDTKFSLQDNSTCLILDPEDWHTMNNFSNGAILLVMASEPYDPKDYIYEPYR